MQSACLALIAAGMILTSSCTKEAGPAGPAGPAGTNGTNGNANVSETSFFGKTFAYIPANSDYEVNLTVSGIADQYALDHTAILVYIRQLGTTSWIQLPASIGSTQYNVIDNIGSVTVSTNLSNANYFDFKVVTIPQ